MSDEPVTSPAELASAAFDGETTPAERVVVTASAALGDEISFYADLRDRLADVTVPDARRESALAAALAVFDQIQIQIQTGTAASTTFGDDESRSDESRSDESGSDEPWTDATSAASAPLVTPRLAPVVSLQQRRSRQLRWIGGTAAAALVAVFAVGIVNGATGSDDDSSQSAATVSMAFDQASGAAEKSTGPAPALATESNTQVAVADTTSEPTADAESTTAAEQAQDTAGGGAAGPVDPAVLSRQAAATLLETDDDVRAFVASTRFGDWALAPTETSTAGSTERPNAAASTANSTGGSTAGSLTSTADDQAFAAGAACLASYPGPAAPALYQGVAVFVVVDASIHRASIIDAANCSILTVVDL